ncbi:MAG: xanthine dehydrogenase family protein molybdopterin-binding subunit, partial [Candidatus Binatia bacterium]
MIGKPTPSIEGRNKVTAEATYLEDIYLRGMLYGKILRSPLPHAKVLHIETEKAKRLPGVEAVITARDMPGIKFSFISDLADKEPLCEDKVRYIGDEVAAVAAIDEYTAWEALDLIKVEYEALPTVFDPQEALNAGDSKVHEKGNIAYEVHKVSGDVERGFSEADYVFEEEYQTSKQAHCTLETRGCIAHFDRTGHLTVWHQTQNPHPLREEIARALGIPEGRIRVIEPEVGGGFGGRLVMNVMVPIAAILSQRTGRPVRIVNTREEEFQCAGTRYPYLFHMKIGVMKDGKIKAKQLDVIGDNGAYNDKGPSTVNFIAASFFTSYDLHSPAKKYDARLIYTNKEPGAAFRGFGHAEERFAFESALDTIAAKLEMDPAELRLKNMKRESDRVCVKTAVERSRWKERRSRRSKKVGIGMAVLSETGGGVRYYGYNSTEAIVKIDRDGSVTLIAPAADTGTGTRTVMAQIAAEELGISMERIKILSNDTDIIPYDLGAWASRTT